jgi:hypothetical protein
MSRCIGGLRSEVQNWGHLACYIYEANSRAIDLGGPDTPDSIIFCHHQQFLRNRKRLQ